MQAQNASLRKRLREEMAEHARSQAKIACLERDKKDFRIAAGWDKDTAAAGKVKVSLGLTMNEESMNEMRRARDAAKKSADQQKLAEKAAKALSAAEKKYEHDLREYELAVF